jgi:RHS repeat-associated protein
MTEAREAFGGATVVKGFSYDPAGRLSTLSVGGAVTERYTFDKNGARLSVEKGGMSKAATYDAQDRLVTFGSATYTYTPTGDRLEKRDGAAVTRYEHDALGRLRRVTLPGGKVVEYTWDGAGRRAGRRVDGALTQGYLYGAGGHLAAEVNAAGKVLAQYGYGVRGAVPDFLIKGGVTYRIVTDYRNSVRLVVDSATGTIAQRLEYDEWGNVTVDTAPGFQAFGYGGGVWDGAVGLLHLGLREYDPEAGQFVEKDPTGFSGGLNLYAYAAGDPVNFVDSTGTNPVVVGAAVGFGWGALQGAALSAGGQVLSKGCIDWGEVGRDALKSGASDAFAGGLGGLWGKVAQRAMPPGLSAPSVPVLNRGSGRDMLREAMDVLKATPRGDRAELAQDLLAQIEARSIDRGWKATAIQGVDGARAWLGEIHGLVIDGTGAVFSGPVGGAVSIQPSGSGMLLTGWAGLIRRF